MSSIQSKGFCASYSLSYPSATCAVQQQLLSAAWDTCLVGNLLLGKHSLITPEP